MRLLTLLLTGWLLIAAAPVRQGPVQRCPEAGSTAGCATMTFESASLVGRQTILRREVSVDLEALQGRPLMVSLIALASSEVSWNGVVIGRNGVPGPDRASEVPGRYISSFVIPPGLVRPGANLLTARLSAHHLWIPIRAPIHVFSVGIYESPELPMISAYVPALLTLGGLLAGFVYFGAAFLSDRRDRAALGIALTAAAGTTQLVVEVIRAFVAYSYPWHIARVGGIAILGAITAALIAHYAARRFAPALTLASPAAALLLSAASLVLMPGFDQKAMGAIGGGYLLLGACAAFGWRKDRLPATVAGSVAGIALALIWRDGSDYLDRSHYLLLSAMTVALVVEQVLLLRRARAERDEQTRRAAALAARLREAEQAGEPILALRDGSRLHRVAESDILAIRAADDYCDAILTDGRSLLVTMTLARLLETLPPRFVRVHRSHAVNRAHVTGAAPRPGGGTLLVMSGGGVIPVGRAYARSVSEWLRPSPSGG